MMEQLVNLTFRGLNLAAQARLLEIEGDAHSAFVEHETPLPVGARLVVRAASGANAGKDQEARVVSVVEQEVGTKTVAGMKIAWVQAAVEPVVVPSAAAPETNEANEGEAPEESPGSATPGDAGGGKRGKRKNRRTLK